MVTFRPVSSDMALPLEVVPDTGANVTAIPAVAAYGVALEPTKIILRGADGKALRVNGAFEARVSLKGNDAFETIYVVSGLSRPLLSRTMMKELGLIYRDFPFQDIVALNTVQSSSETKTERDMPLVKVDTEGLPPHRQPASIPTLVPTKSMPFITEHGPTFDTLMNEFRDLFDGQCTKMKSADYHIELQDDVKPVSYVACRSVPDPRRKSLMPSLSKV
jgi:hypothetical protein